MATTAVWTKRADLSEESVYCRMGVLEGASNQWRLIQHAGRKEMEILIFAVIASYNAFRRQERVVAEPEDFQPRREEKTVTGGPGVPPRGSALEV